MGERWMAFWHRHLLLRQLWEAFYNLVPIIAVIAIFQGLVIRQPVQDMASLLWGSALVVVGLAFFLRGLEQSLFPIGQSMAYAFARRGSLAWLLLFAFALGFATTVAEPTLIAVAAKAGKVATEAGMIGQEPGAAASYALGVRLTVAVSVGFALVVGVLRIVRGWPLVWLIIGGYLAVVVMTVFAPEPIIGLAYDAGGVTTSTVTVPLVTALGIGLASSISGRNPMVDGFGLIAFASLTPMVFVMAYGMVMA